MWRCGIVGLGVIGEMHVNLVNHLPNMSLVAACDVNVAQAKKVLAATNSLNIPIYEDVAEMVRSEKLDVVHICTPSGNHLEPASAAMNAGVNVICEKPLEITIERVDAMLATARKNNVRLAGIFQNRWNPANRALKDAASAGRFGKLAWAGCFTPWYRTDQYYRDGGWRGTWKLDGGGAMMNQSVHQVDLLQWIAGPIKQVSAYASSRIHPEIEVEDTLSCSLQFESGAFGTIMGTTAMYPGGALRVEIGGENGMAVSEDGLKTFRFRDERAEDKDLIERINQKRNSAGGAGSPKLASMQMHLDNVNSILSAWEENRDAETAGDEARKAIAIILAMYESSRKNGQPVLVSQ